MTAPDPVIRPLATHQEREACVALQEETWGREFRDRVPGSILMVAGKVGGVASGAFVGDELVGFVFGLTGLRDGRLVHWSDMLAVRPPYRGGGLGRALKLHQRERLLALGVETMLWTFDPLESRNAHLNLRRLGAIARTYHRDLYGPSDSPLHAGLGTDRLVAEWAMASERVRRRLGGAGEHAGDGEGDTGDGEGDIGDGGPPGDPAAPADPATATLLNPPFPGDPYPRPSDALAGPSGPGVRVAIPRDIQGLKAADVELAGAWRTNVRDALEGAFAAGYVATDLRAGDAEGTSEYVLSLDPRVG